MTHQHVQRIVVGIDGSNGSAIAADFAAFLSTATGAPVLAVHAAGLLDRLSNDANPTITHEHRDEIVEEFTSRWCTPLEGTDFTARVVEGDPASALLRAATDGDLIVVGSRGSGARSELTLGSTSAFVVQHSPVPVTVVPAPER